MKSLHISEIISGNTLRISMKAGRQLEPETRSPNSLWRSRKKSVQTGKGFPDPGTDPSSLHKDSSFTQTAFRRKKTGRVARSYSRTVFSCYVINNNTINGELLVVINDRIRGVIQAVVKYSDIVKIQKMVVQDESILNESGSRPGSIAFGSNNVIGLQKLIFVKF